MRAKAVKSSRSTASKVAKPTVQNKDTAPDKGKRKSKVPAPQLLSLEEQGEIILAHREYGQRLAWSFLYGWRVRIRRDEVTSIVDISLCEAAIRFDKSKNVAFKTFYYYHLRGALLKEISKLIHERSLGGTSAVMDEYNLRLSSPAQFAAWPFPLVESKTPENILQKSELAEQIRESCSNLDDLEQQVLIRHVVCEQSLKDVADELDYCRCHISRVKTRALSKLEEMLKGSLEEEDQGRKREEVKRPLRAALKRYTGGRGRRKVGHSEDKLASWDNLVKLLAA